MLIITEPTKVNGLGHPQIGGSFFFKSQTNIMTKVPYPKTAKTNNELIKLLQSRGMTISDPVFASNVLSSINYYRLSGYWLYYESSRDVFKPGTTFEKVMELYNFDKELRALVFEGISRFEVSLRTRWSNETGMKYGPQAFYYKKYCKDDKERLDNIKTTQKEVKRSKEAFIRHNVNKYTGQLPAAWISCEVMSFGNLSCWYTNLKEEPSKNPSSPGNAKDAIAAFYGVDSHLLESWIHSLSVLRNQCAHQARVVNKKLPIPPKKPKSKKIAISHIWSPISNSYYNLILILIYLNQKITAPSSWCTEMIAFLKANSKKCEEFLCFPTDWEHNSYWT